MEDPSYRFHASSQRVNNERKGIVVMEAFSVPTQGVLTLGKRSYHCAFTANARFVLFNGDSSISRVGQKLRDELP